MNQFFKDKVIWITGASAGIGEALTYALDKTGANLILSARREDELNKVKANCKSAKSVMILPLDLTKSETFADKTKIALESFGHIDILINNGGISQRSLAKDTVLDVDRQIMEVNYFGAVGLTKAVLPSMIARKSGHIVGISSVAGKIGVPLRTGYSGSKFALNGFLEALRNEVWRDNIKVTSICPGFVHTSISLNALTGNGSPQNSMDEATAKGLSAERCAELTLKAIANGKEEAIVAGFRENYGLFMKRFFPRLFSNFIKKAKVS